MEIITYTCGHEAHKRRPHLLFLHLSTNVHTIKRRRFLSLLVVNTVRTYTHIYPSTLLRTPDNALFHVPCILTPLYFIL